VAFLPKLERGQPQGDVADETELVAPSCTPQRWPSVGVDD